MHKQDYDRLAEVTRSFVDDYEGEFDIPTLRMYLTRLTRALKTDNPDFDRIAFLTKVKIYTYRRHE